MTKSTALADGTLGYYEVDNEYPDLTCDGERIFPQGNIRHHRVPDRNLVPHYTPDSSFASNVPITQVSPGNINLIGLQFSNVTYPHEDIVGHRFLISKRTESTKTVLDYGLMHLRTDFDTNSPVTTYSYKGYFGGPNTLLRTKLAGLINPRYLHLKDITSGTHFSIYGVYPWLPLTGSVTFNRQNERLMCPSRQIDLTV